MWSDLKSALIAGGVTLISAVIFWLCSRIRQKAVQNDLNSIKQAMANSGRIYYVVCPECNTRVYLSQAKIGVADEDTEKQQRAKDELLLEFKNVLDNAINQFEKKNEIGGIMEENENKQETSYDEKREIELIAQVRASHEVIGKALAELDTMHANMPVAETAEKTDEAPAETAETLAENTEAEREEVGAKDETEAENINEAEAEVKETEDDKSEADDETKYYY